uniref:Pectin acetylesterase n=1 Tax=Nicotiana sylvestris TaxID=4096 RepID=A0A1U7XEQ2_NICSY|nr:PREDICTED: uncharacterized protein LOC104236989 [Nicotiana sylvestris]
MHTKSNPNSPRLTFLESLNELGPSISRGYFISSCHFHNGIEIQSYWSSTNSPTLANKTIAETVGDWFFNSTEVSFKGFIALIFVANFADRGSWCYNTTSDVYLFLV